MNKAAARGESAREQAAEVIDRWCFVISPIGDTGSETRVRADDVLEFIIRPAAEKCGNDANNVKRADHIDEPGLITTQVILSVVSAPLVIADLTDHNPNVLYELALRHAMKQPVVQICHEKDKLPFDIAAQRTIFYNHQNIRKTLRETVSAVAKQIQAVEADPTLVDNPISTAIDLQALRASADPGQNASAQVLSLLQDLNVRMSRIEASIETVSDPTITGLRVFGRPPSPLIVSQTPQRDPRDGVQVFETPRPFGITRSSPHPPPDFG